MNDDTAERRDFAAPRREGSFGDLDLSYLDPADEDERRILIQAEHPELREALEHDEEIVVDGNVMNPELHIAMHEVVANQIWDGSPPETWETAKLLLAHGYERHEVLHMLGSVVAHEMWRMTHKQEVFDDARFIAGLKALPGSWEKLRGQ